MAHWAHTTIVAAVLAIACFVVSPASAHNGVSHRHEVAVETIAPAADAAARPHSTQESVAPALEPQDGSAAQLEDAPASRQDTGRCVDGCCGVGALCCATALACPPSLQPYPAGRAVVLYPPSERVEGGAPSSLRRPPRSIA